MAWCTSRDQRRRGIVHERIGLKVGIDAFEPFTLSEHTRQASRRAALSDRVATERVEG